MAIQQFGLKLRYEGGDADDHLLELYDGTASLHGFAQALQIATHAYLHGQVYSKATALKGATLYLKAARPGSLIADLIAKIDKTPGNLNPTPASFYDFLRLAFSRATGTVEQEPETPYVRRLLEIDEPFFDDLAETLEGSLQRAHRPIEKGGINRITLERPMGEHLSVFNKQTYLWVNTREEKPDIYDLTGNVTRYNSVTGNGRAYTHELSRIVPFRLSEDFAFGKRGLLTWSLHGSATNVSHQLDIQARRVESAHGEVKRLILVDCQQSVLTN
ncbi:MAG: uncharacterized protein H6R00_147 [Proteobacteria bacterium]|nr:uncharacterized protein [Pseudomonadota bacterium]